MRVATSATSARALGAPSLARAVPRAPRRARSNRARWMKRARATTTTRDDAMSDDDDADVATIHVPSLVRRMRAIARRGCAIIREVTEGGDVGARDKGGEQRADGTYVADAQTEADRRVEAMAIGALRAFSKDLNLVAEESFECAATIEAYAYAGERTTIADLEAEDEDEADETWAPELRKPIAASRVAVYCDPLDGTNEYAAGEREAITVLLGVAVDGTPRAGVIGQPFHERGKSEDLGRVVWGGAGVGVHGLDIAEDALAPPVPPHGAHVVAVNRNLRENRQAPVLEALQSRVDVVISATGFHYLMLLERRAHSALLLRKASKKWDTCAGEALLRATGGIVTDTVGRRYDYSYNLNALPNLSGMAASLDVGMHCEMTGIIRDVIEPLGDYPYDVDDPSIRPSVLDGVQTPAGGWRAVTVDVGGCLIEPRERVADVYARTARSIGIDYVTSETASHDFKEAFAKFRGSDEPNAMRYYDDGKSFWRKVIAHVLSRGGARASADDTVVETMLTKLYEYYEHPSAWYVAHGAVDAISRLRRSGVKVAVASNWDSRLPKLLESLDLARHFDAIVVSAIEGCEKPSKEFFTKCLNAVDVPASATLHVGDDERNDVSGAVAADFACAVLWAPPRPATASSPAPAPRVRDFNELTDAILSANRAHVTHKHYFQ